MKKRKIGFKGERYEEICLEDYVRNWVLLKFRNGNSTFGYLNSLNKREANLFPYSATDYNEDGTAKYYVVGEGLPDTYERMDIVGYRPSTEEEVLNFCNRMNRESYMEMLKKRKEIFELEKINQEIDKSNGKIITP